MEGHAILVHHEGRTLRYLPDSDFEVQAITFPDDGVAWLETCAVRVLEELNPRGEVMSGLTGTFTSQLTEVMTKEDGTWRLADFITNTIEEGHAGCTRDDGSTGASGDIYSEKSITGAREAAEQALVDFLTGELDLEGLSATHTGFILNNHIDIASRGGIPHYDWSSVGCVGSQPCAAWLPRAMKAHSVAWPFHAG